MPTPRRHVDRPRTRDAHGNRQGTGIAALPRALRMRASLRTVLRALVPVAAALAVLAPRVARSQFGTGGTTVSTNLTADALFVAVQKTEGVNLNLRDRALFLNQSSCQCQSDAWVSAAILPSAAAKAAAISPSATV